MRAIASAMLLLALVLGGCASPPQAEILRPDTLAEARTFGPMNEKPLTVQGTGVPDEVGRWIADAVTAELVARGYRRLDSEPDLLGRALLAVTQQRGQWVEASTPGAMSRPVIQTYDWTQGALVIEFYDRRTGDPVWRGTAREAVRQGSGEQQVRAAVRRMFAGFPPAP